MTFYIVYVLKKNSSNKLQKAQCYAIAWLFHFKMSPNTAMAQLLRRLSTFWVFVPYRRTIEVWDIAQYSHALIRQEGYIFRNLPPWSLVCYWGVPSRHTHFLCILHDRNLIRKAVDSLQRNNQYITPLPLAGAERYRVAKMTAGGNV